jgi:hypothetical protein
LDSCLVQAAKAARAVSRQTIDAFEILPFRMLPLPLLS